MEVADQIVVINQGQIEQVGSAAEIYDHPASPFVMNFVGEVNVLPQQPGGGASGDLFVRPHDLELLEEPQDSSIPAVLRRITHLGKDLYAELLLDNGQKVSAQLPRERVSENGLKSGERVHLRARTIHQF